MAELRRVEKEELGRVAEMAREIWEEYFPSIISEAQIAYMLERFQSLEAMTRQVEEEGYLYFEIVAEGKVVGYTAIQEEQDRFFLSKIYLYRAERGKGYASDAINALKTLAIQAGKPALHLTVNRHNSHAISVYRHLGFSPAGAQISPIGNNFVMDDYLFCWSLQ